MGGSGKQSLSRLAAYISSLEVFQVTLRKGYGIPDLKVSSERFSLCHRVSLSYTGVFVCILGGELKGDEE